MSSGWTTPGGHDDETAAQPVTDPAASWSSPPPRPAWGDVSTAPTTPRPGVIPLRPLTVGELLDGAFTTIRRYPAATLGLSALVMLVVTLTQVIASYFLLDGVVNVTASGTTSGDFLTRSLTVTLIVQVVTFLATVILTGMITAVVGQAVLGRPMSAREAWHSARARLAPLAGVSLIVGFATIVLIAVGAGPGLLIAVAGVPAAGIAVAVIGGLAALVAAVWLLVSFELAAPAVMLEKQGVRNALRRSRGLVAGSWWRVFGILLLAGLIASIVSGILVVPFSLAADGTSGLFGGRGYTVHFSGLVLTGIGGFLAGTIVRPFSAGIGALLYIDRRMRAEALDLTLQQAASSAGR